MFCSEGGCSGAPRHYPLPRANYGPLLLTPGATITGRAKIRNDGIDGIIKVHQSLANIFFKITQPSWKNTTTTMRYSGLQREVLSLYRKCLRASAKKPQVSQSNVMAQPVAIADDAEARYSLS